MEKKTLKQLNRAVTASNEIVNNLQESDWANAAGFLASNELSNYRLDIAVDIFTVLVQRDLTDQEKEFLRESMD